MSMVLSRKVMAYPYFAVMLNGVTVSEADKRYITQVEFEDSDEEASIARITVDDQDFKFTSKYKVDRKTPASVVMGYESDNMVMLSGFITIFEANFDEDGIQQLTIGITDKSSEMDTKKRSRSWEKVKRSDVAKKVFEEYGWTIFVEDTLEVQDKITQDNETDIAFVKGMASDEAFELYTFPSEKKAYFGRRFSNLTVNDTLSYKKGDFSIRSFAPSYVTKNKDLSDKTSDTSDTSGSGVSVDVQIDDQEGNTSLDTGGSGSTVNFVGSSGNYAF